MIPGAFGGFQLVTKDEVEAALQNPTVFSSAMEAVDLGQSVPLIPLQVDPPEHVKYRRLLDPIFAPKKMNVLEPDITAMVNGLIDDVIDKGGCEFTEAISVPLPSQVFLRLLGLPLSELDMFLEMKTGILHPPGADFDEMRAHQAKAAKDVERYFAEALAERKKAPQDDILSMFLAAEVAGERLTDDEILGICFLFIIAGLDTVTDTLECFFSYLAQHPEHRRQLVEDPSLIPAAVEELPPLGDAGDRRRPSGGRGHGGGGLPDRQGQLGGAWASARPTPTRAPTSTPTWCDFRGTPSTGPSAAACTAASVPTSPASSCASRCASGTVGSPSTRSPPTLSSSSPSGFASSSRCRWSSARGPRRRRTAPWPRRRRGSLPRRAGWRRTSAARRAPRHRRPEPGGEVASAVGAASAPWAARTT